MVGKLSEVLQRLSRPPEELRAENLRAWAETIPASARIGDTAARSRCRVAGVVQNIRIDPRPDVGSVEATITDGTGTLVARWLGRRSLQGIKLGTGLVIQGMAASGQDDELVLLNPEYELVPGPEHG